MLLEELRKRDASPITHALTLSVSARRTDEAKLTGRLGGTLHGGRGATFGALALVRALAPSEGEEESPTDRGPVVSCRGLPVVVSV